MLGDDYVGVLRKLGQDRDDRLIIEVLKDLTQGRDIAGWQVIGNEIDMSKVDICRGKLALVVLDERWNQVATLIVGEPWEKLTTDFEVSATQIDQAGWVGQAAQELCNVPDVRLGYRPVVASRARTAQRSAALTPQAILVNLTERRLTGKSREAREEALRAASGEPFEGRWAQTIENFLGNLSIHGGRCN